MSDEIGKPTNWKTIEDTINPRDDTHTTDALNTPIVSTPAIKNKEATGQNIVHKLKEGSIKNKAALQSLKKLIEAQLEVFEHQLKEGKLVKKAEATAAAKEMLAKIDNNYQIVLSQIGITNQESRQANIIKLSDATATTLAEIQEKDWPPFMITAAIQKVTNGYLEFLDEISNDLTE